MHIPDVHVGQVSHLLALGKALPGNLELWNADLLKDGDFDEVFKCAALDCPSQSCTLQMARRVQRHAMVLRSPQKRCCERPEG